MKTKTGKLLLSVAILTAINLPLMLILARPGISKEQPNVNFSWQNIVDLAASEDKNIVTEIMAESDNLSGLQITIFSDHPFRSANLELELAEVGNRGGILRHSAHEINLDYLFGTVRLHFDPITDSANKRYAIRLSTADTAGRYSIVTGPKEKPDIVIRPLYKESVFGALYYRTSQFKPTFLKNPVIIFLYLAANSLVILVVLLLVNSTKEKEKMTMDGYVIL